ncbi:hypothetical protein B7494_g1559 [Chlorociboria aeruginascens]|nr:hypothetical protein B7494_g1559 [Chlorociboria aeruginascens]
MAYADEALLSSPDPLNDSPTFQSPPKTRRSSRTRHSLLTQGSSPAKQTFELDVGDQLSPQKIKITVEAGNSDSENTCDHYVDTRQISLPKTWRREKTTTTTVPLKGLSDTENDVQATTPKRGRGRPRKSIGTPTKTGRRVSTPTQKRRSRRSVGDLVDGDDEEDFDFEVGQGVEIERGKGRSRSRPTKGTPRKSTPASQQTDLSENPILNVSSRKGRGRRKTLLPDEVPVLEDANVGGESVPGGRGGQSSGSNGVLEPINANGKPSHSAFSTIRSTTTIDEPYVDDPGVVLARFRSGNETPGKPGWSSPRFIKAPGPLSSAGRTRNHSSPAVSPNKSTLSQQGSYHDAQRELSVAETNQYTEEHEDDVGELSEFDTVLESEGFSMISVGSLPSLREHLSSPSMPMQANNTAKKPRNESYLSAQRFNTTNPNDSFSSIAAEVLEAATLSRQAQNPNLLSIQNVYPNDSFSSISPEVLDAATPRRPKANQVTPVPANNDSKNAYEDSFSAIPSAILEAATPAPLRRTVFKPESTVDPPSTSSRSSAQEKPKSSIQHPNEALLESASTRLLTPDETPSPAGEEAITQALSDGALQSERKSTGSQKGDASYLLNTQLKSSPPSVAPRRYTYTAHLRQQRQLYPDMTQTPSIVFSSPSLPPMPPPKLQPSSSAADQNMRPTLSPIVRAGRVLQGIVVPSSPRGRAQSLGSPFKSPIAERRSSSIARDSYFSPVASQAQEPSLPGPNTAGGLIPSSSKRNTLKQSMHQDDPFSNAHLGGRSPSPQEKQAYTLEMPNQTCGTSSAKSVVSEDAMSWQADEVRPTNEVVVNEQELDPWEARCAAERAEVIKDAALANADQVVVIDSDDSHTSDKIIADDNDELSLLLETLNSSSPAPLHAEEPHRDNLEKPRRGKIPSPWRKSSKKLVYWDELSHLSSPAPLALKVPTTKALASNPRSQPVSVRYIPSIQQTGNSVEEADTSEISVWHIPQKSNFKPRVRSNSNLDLSALLGSSPVKGLPVLPTSSRQSSRESTISVSSSISEDSNKVQSFIDNSAEKMPLAPIPQKQGFKPRVRAAGDINVPTNFMSSPVKPPTSFTKGIFGGISKNVSSDKSTPDISSSLSKALTPPSPSKSNTLRVHQIATVELSPSACSDSIEPFITYERQENPDVNKRTLEWTETIPLVLGPLQYSNNSPTKSCLRSPLKPTSGSGNNSQTSPTKTVAFASSSPLSSPSPTLSSTTWSRAHWLLLDSILQSWKPENVEEWEKEHSRRRSSTRVISNLLGKTISAQGERLKLEQWHLEVVDEFRGKVEGWEELVIAKRVFALVIGEERRALGLIGRRSEGEGEGEEG